MIILFPKRKGVKIATTLIFDLMEKGASSDYLQGAIDFSFAFGAITAKEKQVLMEYLEKRG